MNRSIERAAWCAFDFANSSFTTVVITVVYARWFVNHVVPAEGAFGLQADALWALCNAATMAAAMLLGPSIGAAADRKAQRKRWLTATVVVCCGATALLGQTQDFGASIILLFCAGLAFLISENAVSAFLPTLGTTAELGRISGMGWAVGYCGGLAALLLVNPIAADGAMGTALLLTAAFFFICALPAVLLLREPPAATSNNASDTGALRDLWQQRGHWRDTLHFLQAQCLFQAGVAVVITLAAIYAEEVVGLDDGAVMRLFILLQVTAGLGAWGCGVFQDRFGAMGGLKLSLVVWIAAVLCCTVAVDRTLFHIGAALAGAGMGATQASARAVVGMLAPEGRAATWFGLWGFAGKGGALLGLVCFAVLRSALPLRESLGLCGLLFLGGLVALRKVDLHRGLQAARRNNTVDSDLRQSSDFS